MGIEYQIEELFKKNEALEDEVKNLREVVRHLLNPDYKVNPVSLFLYKNNITQVAYGGFLKAIANYCDEMFDPAEDMDGEIDERWMKTVRNHLRDDVADVYVSCDEYRTIGDARADFATVVVWMGNSSDAPLRAEYAEIIHTVLTSYFAADHNKTNKFGL